MPLRVDYTSLQVAEAIDYAVFNGARVINMSFGYSDVNLFVDVLVATGCE